MLASDTHLRASNLAAPDEGRKTTAENEAVALPDLKTAWDATVAFLAAHRKRDESHWVGELSTSALSTATAISAMVMVRKAFAKTEGQGLGREVMASMDEAVDGGVRWLLEHQNRDGGFGDTDRSHSNIATSLLVLAAWQLSGNQDVAGAPQQRAWDYVNEAGCWDGLRARYGKDKTFVVPILSNCALAGLVDWKQVSPLPFEAAWLPQRWYRLARMPVVSYAVPALVAICQARFFHAPPRNPILRGLRNAARQPTLDVLRRMQPDSGGYLEAVPLTSFVLMNLASMGQFDLPVSQDCLRFILDSRLADGSWPIDTNLATWVTDLTVHSLSRRHGSLELPDGANHLEHEKATEEGHKASVRSRCDAPIANIANDDGFINLQTVRWILRCQHKRRHPFTGAEPGGWGWTDLSGAVPDADDTPAALLALSKLQLDKPGLWRLRMETGLAATRGLRWLTRLQNRDGGWPTFCRGWGKLPFDRSGTDLTAHAIRAMSAWLPRWDELQRCQGGELPSQQKANRAIDRGFEYLRRTQRLDGSWLPLWFGNQDDDREENPIYGTGKVLLAFADTDQIDGQPAQQGIRYLVENQNGDGGWGGGPSVAYRQDPRQPAQASPTGLEAMGEPAAESENCKEIRSTIEETAVALEALVVCGGDPCRDRTIMRGLHWLAEAIANGNLDRSWPIGFYFAKLWYHERLYPAIFSMGAIGAALSAMDETHRVPRG